MMSTRTLFITFFFFFVILAAFPCMPAHSVDARRVLEPDQCSALSAEQIVSASSSAPTITHLQLKSSVLPGGSVTSVEIPSVMPGKSSYCARFVEKNESVTVVSAITTGGQKTTLTIKVPDPGFGVQQQKKLVLAAYPLDQSGKLKVDSPVVSVIQEVWVSNGLFSLAVAAAAVMIAYLIAVLSLGKVGRSYSFDPVYLTSGFNDRASLSQFQIFCFTLLVFGLLIFVLMRTSVLSDISSDVLLLLGISAAGTAGSKVAGIMKKRLSFDNWSWLRNNGWLIAYEAGIGQVPDTKRAHWGDLLKTDGCFDIYSFQLATFSFLVGVALLKSDLSALATFSLPPNLLALLGLSNGVYIAGKAVSPNSVGELDEKVRALREAETAWLAQVTAVVMLATDQQSKLQAAIQGAPERHQTYIAAAREAARMLKTIYGSEGTKFKSEPIADGDIMPVLS